ncbi:MAG: NUDIX domain-containing protein [Candidatus Woesearchaeota archaeon]|nr:MAG: NUDIX domain-containing protein [Candidatus Woesearchaeota archaeon]
MVEYLDIVNEKDEVTGKDLKDNKKTKGFISRTVAMFIADGDKLLITRRSPKKKNSPNKYDVAAFGNVKSGETYEEAAMRELKEELGIECDLKLVDRIFNDFGEKRKYFTGVFLGSYSGNVALSEETIELHKLTIPEIEREMENNIDLFCEGFIKDFNAVKDKLKSMVGNE